jgi:hypothetical protein
VGCYSCGHEPSGLTKDREFLDNLDGFSRRTQLHFLYQQERSQTEI